MKHKSFKKSIALLLTMAMVWGILTVTAVAVEARSAQKVAETEEDMSRAACGTNGIHAAIVHATRTNPHSYSSSWSMRWLSDISVVNYYGQHGYIGELHGQYENRLIFSDRLRAMSRNTSNGLHREAWMYSGSSSPNYSRTGCVAGANATTGWVNLKNNTAEFTAFVLWG